jgi:hypothetical protein
VSASRAVITVLVMKSETGSSPKPNALAALDLIRDDTIQPGHHIIIAMIAALRRYIEKA